MGYAKFVRLTQSLLLALGFVWEVVKAVTSYSLRRAQSSWGDALGMAAADREALGGWIENVRGSAAVAPASMPMAVHYSADKITTQGESKLKVFAGVRYVLENLKPGQDAMDIGLDELRQLRPKDKDWQREIDRASWSNEHVYDIPTMLALRGQAATVMRLDSQVLVMKAANEPVGEEDDSEPTQDSDPEPAQELDLVDDLGLLRWTSPPGSKVLHLLLDADPASLVPVCRPTAFQGAEAELGFAEACATGKPWHSVCVRRLPPAAKAQIEATAAEIRADEAGEPTPQSA